LTTADTNETHKGRLSPPFLSVKQTPSKAKEYGSVMEFKEVYNCEILISEIERRPALYDFAERIQQ